MIKRLTITILLVFCYLSASAQVATPLLDRTMKVQSSAAAGWRDGSTVGLQGVTATGKVEAGSTEVGDVAIGGSIPAVLAALKGEEVGLELYMSTDTTKTVEVEFTTVPGAPDYHGETEQKLPETRLNLAYIFGEALSIGLGYRVNEVQSEEKVSGTVGFDPIAGAPIIYSSPVTTSDYTETETGLMVSASLKLADIFYVAGGMENVDLKTSSAIGSDLVDNAWTNMIIGLGLLVGDPGESRFRVEYAIIQSPESKKDAETGKGAHNHYKTDYATMSLEALFGNISLSYISETKKVDYQDEKTVSTQIGAGWMPEEGLSVSVYMVNFKQTYTDALDGTEMSFEPKGYRVNIGWNF